MNQRLAIIIEVLVIIGLYFWYIQPTYTVDIQAIHTKINTDKVTSATMKRYSQQELQLEKKQNNISSLNSTRISRMLPNTNDTAHFLLNINTLALRSGFTLDKFDIQNQDISSMQNVINTKQKLYQTFTIGVSGKGTYSSFRQFLDGLERSLRIVDVTSLSIKVDTTQSANKKTSQISSYEYSLKLKIYKLQQEL